MNAWTKMLRAIQEWAIHGENTTDRLQKYICSIEGRTRLSAATSFPIYEQVIMYAMNARCGQGGVILQARERLLRTQQGRDRY